MDRVTAENTILRSPKVKFEDYFKDIQPGLVMEFGVAGGNSLRRIAQYTNQTVWGFDSFEGLPEDWRDENGNVTHIKGTFKSPPPYNAAPNIKLVVGLFQSTLPKFLEEHKDPISFVHVDCDLYSSHKFVLSCMRDRLNGAVIVFDDIVTLPRYIIHGLKAFVEFIEETGYKWDCLGRWKDSASGMRLYK